MKKSISYLFMVILILGFTSCNCSKTITKTQDPKAVDIRKTAPGEESITTVIPYTIDSVWVENLMLHVDLTYTGHKSDVGFDLIFNGAWLKSYPPKANLNLVSTVATAKGGKKVKHHLTFDLTPLQSINSFFEVYVVGYKQGFRIGGE